MNNQGSLFLIIGLPGAGKSTLANYLSKKINAPILSTELFRSILFDTKNTNKDIDFSETELEIVYNSISYITAQLSHINNNLIVEGVFRNNNQRLYFLNNARNFKKIVKIFLFADEDKILFRLRTRKSINTSIAPAGPSTYLGLIKTFQKPDDTYQIFNTSNLSAEQIGNDILENIGFLN